MIQIENAKSNQPDVELQELHSVVSNLTDSIKTLNKQVSTIKAHISKLEKPCPEWMTIQQLSDYLPSHPGVSTIYRWVAENSIPHRRGEKSTHFVKSEIDEWMNYKSYVPDWWHDRKK